MLRWGYKRAREYARRLKYYRGDLVTAHPQFKPGSAAAPNLVASPVALSAPDIVYSPEDDEAIDEYTRKTGPLLPIQFADRVLTNSNSVETTWHSVSACNLVLQYSGWVFKVTSWIAWNLCHETSRSRGSGRRKIEYLRCTRP